MINSRFNIRSARVRLFAVGEDNDKAKLLPTTIDEWDLLLPRLLMNPLVLSPPLLVLYNFGLELFFRSRLSFDSRNVGSKCSFES